MLLTDEDIQERIESPGNLLNRLRAATSKAQSPLLPPKVGDLIPNLDEKIGPDVKKQATEIMNSALRELKARIPEVHKPEKLAQIIKEMNTVVTQREEKDPGKTPQFIVYAPQVIQETHFETIVLQEDGI